LKEDVLMTTHPQETESEPETEDLLDPHSCEAIGHIEDMVMSFLSQLAFSGRSQGHSQSDETSELESEDAKSSGKPLKTNSRIELKLADRSKQGLDGADSSRFRTIRYPRKCSTGSAKPLAQLFRVLDLAHEAVIDQMPTTKRDIYYKDVALFKNQRTIDNLVDDLAATFEMERSDLNIRATSKGLICGAGLTIHLVTGDTIEVNDTEGTLIPVGEDIESFNADESISWVLVVEKEAVFQTLCRLRLATHSSLSGHGLIITACRLDFTSLPASLLM